MLLRTKHQRHLHTRCTASYPVHIYTSIYSYTVLGTADGRIKRKSRNDITKIPSIENIHQEM